MATNIDAKYGSNHATMAKIRLAMKNRRHKFKPGRVWTVASGAPTIDSGASTAATYPVAAGDWCYDIANDDAYQCTVKVSATTAATFVKCNA